MNALIQAAGFSKPFSGSFKILFSQSKGALTVQFQMSDDLGGTYLKVTGDSEHILYNYHDTIIEPKTMNGIVVLNNRLLEK